MVQFILSKKLLVKFFYTAIFKSLFIAYFELKISEAVSYDYSLKFLCFKKKNFCFKNRELLKYKIKVIKLVRQTDFNPYIIISTARRNSGGDKKLPKKAVWK